MYLEVIAKNLDDIRAINQSNANRIEFCDNLDVGGLTQSIEKIREAINISEIPVNVIVRNITSFYPNEVEIAKMIDQIRLIAQEKNVNGIVIGALNQDDSINKDFLRQVNLVRRNLEITFHRAFNHVRDLEEGLAVLDSFNINNVLTTGDDEVTHGLAKIKKIDLSKYRVKILLGGGIDLSNLKEALFISNNIHIGRAARVNHSWDQEIDVNKINEFCH